MAKSPKYIVNEVRDGRFVRAWTEGRSTVNVQVWSGDKPEGEPAGDWAMPRVLGIINCIEQAMRQTDK